MRNKRLLLAWWSNTGGTAALVDAAAQGAEQAARELGPTDTHLSILSVRCDRLSAQALQRADGLILATPECLGTVAGPMKSWIDRCYYPALETLAG
jgi:multimeric flavodoxin WrbA